ncbi:unnamed protein product [Hyaloperonospora brassicae]|uniref:chitin synthase n=1 Tax=Hyaloperonospora brassicae TaxID=162125 RepID=A0AAV0UGE0_HYABA|nr:unnamed protein product [Hyaloperonospora brassicae]
MANVAERRMHAEIHNSLASEVVETSNRSALLRDWVEERVQENHPRPGVHNVGTLVRNWDEDWVGPSLDEEEARRLWYTPVFCPLPLDFSNFGYRLRCVETGRRPRLMVCITMYNEEPEQLQATLTKLANNLAYLKEQQLTEPLSRKNNPHALTGPFAGDNVWQNVLICIVADGRGQVNGKMLEYLESIGLYDEDLLTINSAGIDTQCHLFEHTLQLSVDGKCLLPLQTVFALKEHKSSKLDSHRWYFDALAEQVQPEYTAVMDVGTMLTKSALYHVLFAMERNQQIGGACGHLTVDEAFENLSNWVVSAQHFEYKISNILDKSLESCFGFISVLPGAFSAYRYEAIRGAPLDAYFLPLNVDLDVLGPFLGNMYLAEDRILSFEVVARKDCSWTMHYVKDAVARTDVPHNLVGLISQRKRWLNGAFFATLFCIRNWGRIYSESSHSFPRKMAFLALYLYHLMHTVFGFFLPATLYLALFLIVFQGFQQNRLGFVDTSGYSQTVLDGAVYLYNFVYLFGLLMLIIIGMGNNPEHMKFTYYFLGAVFGGLMMLSSLVGLAIFFTSPATAGSIVVLILAVGVYFVGPALHGEVHHIFMTAPQYMVLIPTFLNIATVYSFCNLHDLSWGTKGLHDLSWSTKDQHNDPLLVLLDETKKGDLEGAIAKRRAMEESRRKEKVRSENTKKRFEAFRTKILLTWALSNLVFALVIVYFTISSTYLHALFICAAGINSCRLLGCFGHLVYMHVIRLRDRIFDKTEYENGTGRYAQDSYVQLDEHYAALTEDQRVSSAGRINMSARSNHGVFSAA